MHSSPSGAVAAQVRKLRQQRGLNRHQLAERCSNLGYPQLTPAAITNIETGRPDAEGKRRRDVTLEELLVLAVALKVAPVDLVVPTGSLAEEEEQYPATPRHSFRTGPTREWVRGEDFLVEPRTAAELTEVISTMPPDRGRRLAEKFLPLLMGQEDLFGEGLEELYDPPNKGEK